MRFVCFLLNIHNCTSAGRCVFDALIARRFNPAAALTWEHCRLPDPRRGPRAVPLGTSAVLRQLPEIRSDKHAVTRDRAAYAC